MFSKVLRPGAGDPLTEVPGPARHRIFLEVVPFLLMGAVVAVDLLAGPSEGFVPVLSLGPAIASVSRRAYQTALIGGLAFILGFFLVTFDNLPLSRKVIALLTILGVTAAGVVASGIRQRQEQELANVRAVAEVAQQVVLRPVPQRTDPLQIAVRYASASAAARIGGDLYEVISTPKYVRFILGDVQGKGLPAVRTAAVVLGAFREAAFDVGDLIEIATRIELSLQHQAIDDEFVTALIGQAVVGKPAVELLSCGHPPPLLIRNGVVTPVEDPDPGLVLGLANLGPSLRTPMSLPFGPGDQLLLYTDGVSEARDKAGTFYPLSRCARLLRGDPETALDRLQGDVIRHVGHALDDDAAMLLIRPAEAGRIGLSQPGSRIRSLIADRQPARTDRAGQADQARAD